MALQKPLQDSFAATSQSLFTYFAIFASFALQELLFSIHVPVDRGDILLLRKIYRKASSIHRQDEKSHQSLLFGGICHNLHELFPREIGP